MRRRQSFPFGSLNAAKFFAASLRAQGVPCRVNFANRIIDTDWNGNAVWVTFPVVLAGPAVRKPMSAEEIEALG